MEIEERGGVYVVVYEDGSCHPANDDEVQMWKELSALKVAAKPVVEWWEAAKPFRAKNYTGPGGGNALHISALHDGVDVFVTEEQLDTLAALVGEV